MWTNGDSVLDFKNMPLKLVCTLKKQKQTKNQKSNIPLEKTKFWKFMCLNFGYKILTNLEASLEILSLNLVLKQNSYFIFK